MYKALGYGINVGRKLDHSNYLYFERYTTVGINDFVKAEKIYNVLNMQNELNLWQSCEIVKIYVNLENGNYEYEDVTPDSKMLDKNYWDDVQSKNSQIIHSFSIDEERTDKEDLPINICWLKFGYVSKSSGCGFFHYQTVDEFKKLLKSVTHISCDDISKKELIDYIAWLSDNTLLLPKSNNIINTLWEELINKGGK